MAVPTPYGPFHVFFIITSIFCGFLISRHCTNKGETFIRRFLLIEALLITVLEIYKQINFSFHIDGSQILFDYQWYAFPFQFCSTPMYVMLAAALFKNGKAKTCICSFLATYGLFAGAAVMFYPGDVFVKTIGINVQTMIHHGMMVVIGVLMYVTGRAKLSHKTILYALPVFALLIALALGSNVLYHYFGDPEQTFNMFYISPYYPCTLPVLNMIYPVVPYPVFLLLYLFGFTAAGYVMSLLAMGVHAIFKKVHPTIISKEKQY